MRLRAEAVGLGPLSLYLTLYLGRRLGLRVTASRQVRGRPRKYSACTTWSPTWGTHLALETPRRSRWWSSRATSPQRY